MLYGFRITAIAVLLTAAVHPALAQEFKAGSLQISHPWAVATPALSIPDGFYPNAGCGLITNSGAVPDRLLSATTEISWHMGILEPVVKDGKLTLRLLDGLPIPANGSVPLLPWGPHLVFMDFKRPVKEGESFSGTLTFEKAGTVNVTFVVETMGAARARGWLPGAPPH